MKSKKSKKFENKMTNKAKSNNNVTNKSKTNLETSSNQNNICDKCNDRFDCNELQ